MSNIKSDASFLYTQGNEILVLLKSTEIGLQLPCIYINMYKCFVFLNVQCYKCTCMHKCFAPNHQFGAEIGGVLKLAEIWSSAN